MTDKKLKAIAEPRGIYKLSHLHNLHIPLDDPFRDRLTDRDWALCLGHGEYLVLQVQGYQVTGIGYRFHAKPMTTPLRWKPTDREVGLLLAGKTIEAPMDLMHAAHAMGVLTPIEPPTNGDTPRDGVPARQTTDDVPRV